MSNIYLEAEKKLTFSKLRFSKSNIIFSGSRFVHFKSRIYHWTSCCIRLNLRVAQNGRFVKNPVYPGGDTMFAKFLDFSFFESLKNALFRAFCSPNISLESWILHCLRENFLKYSPDIAICTLTVYLNLH